MEHQADGSASGVILNSEATANQEAEAQQQLLIEEEERSTDALARDLGGIPTVEDVVPNGYAILVSRGAALTAERLELQSTTQKIRAAADAARESAVVTRNESISIRLRCSHRWIKA